MVWENRFMNYWQNHQKKRYQNTHGGLFLSSDIFICLYGLQNMSSDYDII